MSHRTTIYPLLQLSVNLILRATLELITINGNSALYDVSFDTFLFWFLVWIYVITHLVIIIFDDIQSHAGINSRLHVGTRLSVSPLFKTLIFHCIWVLCFECIWFVRRLFSFYGTSALRKLSFQINLIKDLIILQHVHVCQSNFPWIGVFGCFISWKFTWTLFFHF